MGYGVSPNSAHPAQQMLQARNVNGKTAAEESRGCLMCGSERDRRLQGAPKEQGRLVETRAPLPKTFLTRSAA